MSLSISSSSFHVTKLHESAYELNIQFYDEKSNIADNKQFTFCQGGSATDTEIYDVFTKNGSSLATLSNHLFIGSDFNFAKKVTPLLLAKSDQTSHICALDLQHPTLYYAHSNIENSENAVCSFLTADKPSKDASKNAQGIHKKFKETLAVDFVLKEGTLKQHLLTYGGFTDSQAAFFNSEKGYLSMCQTAEFFMNAIKLGESVRVLEGTDFVHSISGKTFTPCKTSTNFYPELYKDIYSSTGNFAKQLGQFYSISGEFHIKSEITTLQIKSPLS